MEEIKCFDIASMVIDEASLKFSPDWKINEEFYGIFKGYCEVVDKTTERSGKESLEVFVDDETKVIEISIVCADYEANNRKNGNLVNALFERAVEVKVLRVNSDLIKLVLTFPSLWEKV